METKNKSLEQLIQAYLCALPSAKKSNATVRTYGIALQDLQAFAALKNYEQIEPIHILEWRSHLAAKVKANTVRHYMICAHAFFAWCVRNGLLPTNPVNSDEIPPSEQRQYNLLSRSEIMKLFNEYPRRMFKADILRNRAIIILLLQAGLRSAEIRALTPADLDFERGVITVQHGKGDKRRMVAFPMLSQEVVFEYLNCGYRPPYLTDDDFLFGTMADESGHPGTEWHQFSTSGLRTLVSRYVEKVTGHKGIKTHTLRHAAASLWDDMGVPLRTIQTALGHSSIVTTEKIYVEVLNKGKAACDINAAFAAIDK